MITGFVIGKFFPFHLGHMYLVDVARANCDRLIVCICEKQNQSILGSVRADWIKELYPDVEVRIVPDTLADDDTQGWADYTLRFLGRSPDIVFSSEDYGEPYAQLMGSKHFMVDKYRVSIPISGTKIRSAPYDSWDYLAPPLRAYFAKRVVVLGSPSTGTTTLVRALAEHYKTEWVPEYGRDYCNRRKKEEWKEWQTEEFIHIASEQLRNEDESSRHANKILLCDTDAFATTVWHRRYMGSKSAKVERIANQRKHDLYIVTGDEIPFVQDGTRDGEELRHDMHQWFIEDLQATNRNYIVVTGSPEERLAQATQAIDKLMK